MRVGCLCRTPSPIVEKGLDQAMERIGIEPMTSGLQVQSRPHLRMFREVRSLKESQCGSDAQSVSIPVGQRELTQI